MGEIPSGGMWKVRTMNKMLARLTALGASAALVLMTIVIFVPPAAAQGGNPLVIEVTVDPDNSLPNGRLLPETGTARATVKVKVTYQAATACIITVNLQYKASSSPPYSTVIFNPPSRTVTFSNTQAGGQPVAAATPVPIQAEDVEMIVTTKRDAPAFEDGKYEVQVDAQGGTAQGGCNAGTASAKGSTTIKNDYLPLTVVNPSSLFVKAGQNKKVVFPVELSNLGNGPTRIKVEATQPNKNKLDAINVGAEVRLESRAGKGAAAQFKTTRNVEVQTPHANGYSNSIYQFNVKYTSAFDGAAAGTLATDEQTVAFAVQVQGVYVPGFDPTLLIGALGVGLLLMRRKSPGA
jgi:hypothetical protein